MKNQLWNKKKQVAGPVFFLFLGDFLGFVL